MSAYRTDDTKFPFLSHQVLDGQPFKFLMTNERSVNWYNHDTPGNEEYLSLITPGCRVLDLGANEGYTTVLAALKTGPTGKVIAVEPAPHNQEPLKINLALNQLEERVEVIPCAISEAPGEIQFDGEAAREGEGKVQVITLDNLAAFAPDVVKIDIEGFELKALRGGLKMLTECRPVIFLEAHLDRDKGGMDMRQYGDQPEELFKLMTDLGYQFHQYGGVKDYCPPDASVLRHVDSKPVRKPFVMPKMVCLTLRANMLKKERAMQEFKRTGLDVEFFNGFDNRRAMLRSTVMGRYGDYIKSPMEGCNISHMMLWEWLLHTPYEEVLIFEDDVLLPPDFLYSFQRSYEALPDDWQMVYVGSDQIENRIKDHVNDRVSKIHNPYGTHAYMVRRSALPILLATNEVMTSSIDIQIGTESLPRLRHYAFVPSLVKQMTAERDMR